MRHMIAALAFLLLPVLFSCSQNDSGNPPISNDTPPAEESLRAPQKSARTPPVYVKLPSGWQSRNPISSTVQQSADLWELEAHFTLTSQSKSDVGIDVITWAQRTKRATAEQSTLTNRRETDLIKKQIGDHAVYEYEIFAGTGDRASHARVIMFEIGAHYCKILCWTYAPHWEALQPRIDELVDAVQVAEDDG